jgi:glycosyltransferase involved in cell wall biosynthesis
LGLNTGSILVEQTNKRRILYVYIGNYDEPSGVRNKLDGLFAELRSRRIDCTVFTYSGSVSTPGFDRKNFYLLPLELLANGKKTYSLLDGLLATNGPYEKYFFRYPLASAALHDFMKKHPGKFIFEHNTVEIAEIRNEAMAFIRKFKTSVTPSYFRLLTNSLIKPVVTEKFLGGKVLRLAHSGIAVTNEIAKYEARRVNGYKCSVVPNGIDVKRVVFRVRDLKPGLIATVIMVANCGVNWHGTDLVLRSFNRYAENNIRLILVGELDEHTRNLAKQNPNIHTTGFLQEKELNIRLQEAHAGLGSFALFRKGLLEGSTLKVREYLSSGLPLITGHIDPLVEESAIFKACRIRIDIKKEKIDWNSIYSWLIEIYKKPGLNQTIRDEAMLKVDFSSMTDAFLKY